LGPPRKGAANKRKIAKTSRGKSAPAGGKGQISVSHGKEPGRGLGKNSGGGRGQSVPIVSLYVEMEFKMGKSLFKKDTANKSASKAGLIRISAEEEVQRGEKMRWSRSISRKKGGRLKTHRAAQ